MTNPILFLIFNRPETTRQVFSAIKQAKPSKLYVAADGPRLDKAGEQEVCEKVRAIIKEVDWDCEVKTLFRQENLGCKVAVSSAIKWFFDNEEQGIILEDDCLPSQSFFTFCDELLEKYKDDERIAIISGDNFRAEKNTEFDYYPTRIPHIWGWATWRRVWQKYNVALNEIDKYIEADSLKYIWPKSLVRSYWYDIFRDVERGKINTWDYQLAFLVFRENMLCLCPSKNLVSNIGFGADFTNTLVNDSRVSGLRVNDLSFPLRHPEKLEYSWSHDSQVINILLKNYRFKKLLKSLHIFSLIKKIYALYYLRK